MDLFTIKSAAKSVSVPYLALWKWIDNGVVPCVLIDGRKFLSTEGIDVARALAEANKIKFNSRKVRNEEALRNRGRRMDSGTGR